MSASNNQSSTAGNGSLEPVKPGNSAANPLDATTFKTSQPDPTSAWLLEDVFSAGYKNAGFAKKQSVDDLAFGFLQPSQLDFSSTKKSSPFTFDFADLNTTDWNLFNFDLKPHGGLQTTDQVEPVATASVAADASKEAKTDAKGNKILVSGKNEITIDGADGSQHYRKHGSVEETDSPDHGNTYDRATGVATQTDKQTGITRTYGPNGAFEQTTATGEKTSTLKEPYKGQNLPPGKYLGKDADGDPVFVHVFVHDGQTTVVEVEKDDSGDKNKTKVVVRGDDYMLKSASGHVIVYDKNGQPLFTDANGKPLAMTQEELMAHYDRLPPGLQKTLSVLNHKINVQGVQINEDGYQSAHTRVCRDHTTGNIRAVTENTDGKGHAEVDVVAKDHSEIGIQGVSNTIIDDHEAKTVDANNKVIASYNFDTQTFTTEDATFTTSDTNINWAAVDISNNGDWSDSDQNVTTGGALMASCTSAGTNAIDLCQFVSSRFGTESVTSGMCDAMNAAVGHLTELKAMCTATGNLDALGAIDQGLSYLSSVLPTATAMAAIDRELTGQGKDRDQILAAQKMLSTKTAESIAQGFS